VSEPMWDKAQMIQAHREVDDRLRQAREEIARRPFRLPPLADAEKAGPLMTLCDALEMRLREAERLANPLSIPHAGRFLFLQRVVRRIMRPTLEHQVRMNAATLAALRAEVHLLQAILAAQYPVRESGE
jgi:hypothetical protein